MLIVSRRTLLALGVLAFLSTFYILPAQTLTSSPDNGRAGNTVTVTVSGSGVNFNSATPSVVLQPNSGTPITSTFMNVTSSTTLTATFSIPLSATVGAYAMQVGNVTGFIPGVFTVTPPGSLISLTPNGAAPGTTVNVLVSGSGTSFNSSTPTSNFLVMQPASGPSIISNVINPINDSLLQSTITIPSGATIGSYAVRINNMTNYTPGLFTVFSNTNSGTITGKVYHDVSEDCIEDPGEPPLPGFIVKTAPGNYYGTVASNGDYQIIAPPGNYTVEVLPPPYFSRLCPVSPISVSLPSAGATTTGHDFAVEGDTLTDGAVSCGFSEFRPGFNTIIHVQVVNAGLQALTGEVQIVLDTNLTYLSSNPMATVSGDTVKWPITTPMPYGAISNFTVTVNLPTTVPLGTMIANESIIVTDSADVNTENDNYVCAAEVIGSYDPNDKTVWNQDMVLADPGIEPDDSVLIYRIRFQNTGTASAINVFIRDTLSNLLDPGSLEMIGTSHAPYTFEMTGEGNLEWRFPNIYLPDSNSNEPASHGYVLFKIRPKSSFGLGASILNDASIYFDFNAPVVTNEVSTSILVSREDPETDFPVTIYPNPAADRFRVEFDCGATENGRCRLFDPFGNVVRELETGCEGGIQRVEISVTDLSAGVYFLETKVAGQRAVHKVTVLK